MHCAVLGSMFTPFFSLVHVRNMMDAKTCDTRMFAAFFNFMLQKGFYLPPSQFETAFISTAHTRQDIDAFIDAASNFRQ
jgi:glutamate-1-semialdehyde 2,1-aminomutase